MRRLKQISTFLLVVVSITMYLLSVMPHHHHATSDAPCLNALHCLGMAACGHEDICSLDIGVQEGSAFSAFNFSRGYSDADYTGCCNTENRDFGDAHGGCGHPHHSEEDNCSFDAPDAVTPEREGDNGRGDLIAAIPVELFGLDALSFFIEFEECGPTCPDGHSRHPLPFSPLDEYFARALSPRAPSFTA